MEKRAAVVIAPCVPSLTSGYGIALYSSLYAYSQEFDVVHCVCIAEHTDVPAFPELTKVQFHIVCAKKGGILGRFVRSIVSLYPAIGLNFASRKVRARVETTLSRLSLDRATGKYLILEDVPTSFAIMLEKKGRKWRFGARRIALRSHNVLGDAFSGVVNELAWFESVAWRFEIKKIRAWERRICRSVDAVWAISGDDRDRYNQLGIECSGVLGAMVPGERYQAVGPGRPDVIVYVGTADLRKGQGLRKFVALAWPIIKSAWPDTTLVLAGRGTEIFNDPRKDIVGLGFVEDEAKILELGTIFLNPQESGSGLKVKSIVAMLAGKVLVSTKEGIRGIPGTDGVHFIACEDQVGIARAIVELRGKREFLERIRVEGRRWASWYYSKARFTKDAQALLRSYIAND